MKSKFKCSPQPVLGPVAGCDWADTMVLNPAIFKDKENGDLHMIFRSTGPSDKKMPGNPYPLYPIFLGYAVSHDNGETFDADFSEPCLAPALEFDIEKIRIKNYKGEYVPDYTNGCIEDPRVFELEGKTYLTAACRMFAPGPYWDAEFVSKLSNRHIPAWAMGNDDNPYGKVASRIETVTVLYEIDVDKLKEHNYKEAFTYICPLTDGNRVDNRDVYFFPEKLMINGKRQYVMVHRPQNPHTFDPAIEITTPSIMLACAEEFEDFVTDKATHVFFEAGAFDWCKERIGGSYPPIRINEKEWLFPIHGKTAGVGYTQSFYIVEERENDFPVITHKCSDRLMYASQEWEMPDIYPDHCIFATAGVVVGEELIISYGAADQFCGIAKVNFDELVAYIRQFDGNGKRM